jgi:hypothetical protein
MLESFRNLVNFEDENWDTDRNLTFSIAIVLTIILFECFIISANEAFIAELIPCPSNI